MDGLTTSELNVLLAPRKRKTKDPTGKGKVWDATQNSFVPFDSKMHDLGTYTGRVGTTRRNNKGGTKRMPNGSRRYLPWNPNEVTAYKLT